MRVDDDGYQNYAFTTTTTTITETLTTSTTATTSTTQTHPIKTCQTQDEAFQRLEFGGIEAGSLQAANLKTGGCRSMASTQRHHAHALIHTKRRNNERRGILECRLSRCLALGT